MDWGLADWRFWAASIPLTVMYFFIIKYVMKKRNWHWSELPAAMLMLMIGLGSLTRENRWVPVFFFVSATILLVQWYRKRAA